METTYYVVREIIEGEPVFRPFETFESAWAERTGLAQVMKVEAADPDSACAQARWDWGWGSDAQFCTRDGVTLTKQVRMPEVASFHELFDAFEPWDFSTMNARNGDYEAEGKRVRSEYGTSVMPSPFASVDLGQIGGPRFGNNLAVRPNARLRELLRDSFELSGWKLIAHRREGRPDRVLVIASHQFISGGPWIAYIDADTVPTFEKAAN